MKVEMSDEVRMYYTISAKIYQRIKKGLPVEHLRELRKPYAHHKSAYNLAVYHSKRRNIYAKDKQ